MDNDSLYKIIDYLKNSSIGEVEDYARRRDVWQALNIDKKEHIKKLNAIKKRYKVENTITKKINEEKQKYHKKIREFQEIDNNCKKLEEKLLDYCSNFSSNSAKNKNTPVEIKKTYRLWSETSKKRKFKSENLGEEIVALYYEFKNIEYVRSISVETARSEENVEKKYHEPDGLEDNLFYVEVKMRAYQSSGTANEKIPSVAFKYADLPNKIKLYLLADDEHKYNTYWSKLVRGDIESSNKYNSEFENKYVELHKDVIEKIIYGSEIAEEFEKFLK